MTDLVGVCLCHSLPSVSRGRTCPKCGTHEVHITGKLAAKSALKDFLSAETMEIDEASLRRVHSRPVLQYSVD